MSVQIIVSEFFPYETGLIKDEVVYAIGDVHGYAENLKSLIEHFEQNNTHWQKNSIILLGDLIDRGPNNLGCLDLAIGLTEKFNIVHSLQGNHEALLRIAYTYNKPKLQKTWLKHGGKATLEDIGIDKLDFSSHDNFRHSIKAALGSQRVEYLENLKSHCQIGKLLFVHAGTDPNNSLESHFKQLWHERSDTHWCWIRDNFLNQASPFTDLCVIHGHTPVYKQPYSPNDNLFIHHKAGLGKMNLDGGSYATGCVTGAQFNSEGYQIICAIHYH